jgi:uncharacterized membrane protein
VYIHAFLFGCWIVWNLGWIPGLPLFDPSFVVLVLKAIEHQDSARGG